MAEERIKYSDLFEEDIFEIARKSAERLLETIQAIDKALKDMGEEVYSKMKETDKLQVSLLRKQAEELAKIGKVKKDLIRTEIETKGNLNKLNQVELKLKKEIEKNQENLIKISKEEYKQILQIKESIKEKNKQLRETIKNNNLKNELEKKGIKITQQQIGKYAELNKKLGLLRRAYKDLKASGTANVEELSKLKDEIQKLDNQLKEIDADTGQFQRNVGDYAGQLKDHFAGLQGSLDGLGEEIGALSNLFTGMWQAFTSGMQGATKGTSKFKRVLLGLRGAGVVGFVLLLVGAFKQLASIVGSLRSGQVAWIRTTERLKVVWVAMKDVLIQVVYLLKEQWLIIFDLLGGVGKFITGDFKEAWNMVSDIKKRVINIFDISKNTFNKVSKITDKINKLNKTANEIIKERIKLLTLELDLIKNRARLEYERSRLELEYEKLIENDKINPLTRIGKQLELLSKLEKKTREQGEMEIEIARRKLKIASIRYERERDNIDLLEERNQAEADYYEALKNNESELMQVYTERKSITKELLDLNIEYLYEVRRLNEEIIKARADLEDNQYKKLLSDRQAEIQRLENERAKAIAEFQGVQKVFEAISSSLLFNFKLIPASLEKEYNTLIELTKQKYDKLIKDLETTAKEKLTNILIGENGTELDKKLNAIKRSYIQKASEMEEAMRSLGRTEEEILLARKGLEENRFLEEKEAVLENNRKKINEESKFQKEYTKIVIKDKEEREKAILEIEKERLQKTAALLEEQLQLYKSFGREQTEEYKKLFKEYQLIQARLSTEFTTSTADKNKQFIESLKEGVNELIQAYDLLKTYLDKVSEASLKNIDTQVAAIDRRINKLENMAKANLNNIDESLADLEKQKEELLLERKELERQKQRRELLLTALNTYQGYLQQGKTGGQALLSTIKDISLLKSFISSLPVYHTGTEYVKGNAREVLAKLEVGERIIPKEMNKKLGNITNEQLIKKITEERQYIDFNYDNLKKVININNNKTKKRLF